MLLAKESGAIILPAMPAFYHKPKHRLLHYSTTLNIKGESYRLKEKRKAGLLGRPNLDLDQEQPENDPL